MTERQTILIVDDDPIGLKMLRLAFIDQYRVLFATGGEDALAIAYRELPDLIILDVMMPVIDGFEVLRQIRKRSEVPVIMLTARTAQPDRITGLNTGADDYLPKPCSPRELLARLRAVLRRTQPSVEAELLRAGRVSIDVPHRDVRVDDRHIELTGLEFDLLVALARKAGRVVSREALLSGAGRDDVTIGERAVDVHVSHLRQKLGDDPKAPTMIRTIRGAGYVLLRDGDAPPV